MGNFWSEHCKKKKKHKRSKMITSSKHKAGVSNVKSSVKKVVSTEKATLFVGPHALLRLRNSNLFHLYQDVLLESDQYKKTGPGAMCASATRPPMLSFSRDHQESILRKIPAATHFEAIFALHRLKQQGEESGEASIKNLIKLLTAWRPTLESLRLWITGIELRDESNSPLTTLSPLWAALNDLPKLTVLHLDVQVYEVQQVQFTQVNYMQVRQVAALPLTTSLLHQLRDFRFYSNSHYVWKPLLEGYNQRRPFKLDQLQNLDELEQLARLHRPLLERATQLAIYLNKLPDLQFLSVCLSKLTSLRLVNKYGPTLTLVQLLKMMSGHATQLVTLRYETQRHHMDLGLGGRFRHADVTPTELLPSLKTLTIRVEDRSDYAHSELNVAKVIARFLPGLEAYQMRIEYGAWCRGHFPPVQENVGGVIALATVQQHKK